MTTTSGTLRTRSLMLVNDVALGPEVGEFQITVDNQNLSIRRYSAVGAYEDIQNFSTDFSQGPSMAAPLGTFVFHRDVLLSPGRSLTISEGGKVMVQSPPLTPYDAVNKAYIDSLTPSVLEGISDVEINNPQTGQVLNFLNGKWVNANVFTPVATEVFHYSGSQLDGSTTVTAVTGSGSQNILLPAFPFSAAIDTIAVSANNVPSKPLANHQFLITVHNALNGQIVLSDTVSISDSSKILLNGKFAVVGSKKLLNAQTFASGDSFYVTIGGYDSDGNEIGVVIQFSGSRM